MATCQPATDIFVEIWNCNAQGEYSAFGSASQTGGGNGTAPTGNGTAPTGAPPGSSVSGSESFTQSGSASMSLPSGGMGGGGGGGGSSGKANGDNFLRGGYAANENGIAELTVCLSSMWVFAIA